MVQSALSRTSAGVNRKPLAGQLQGNRAVHVTDVARLGKHVATTCPPSLSRGAALYTPQHTRRFSRSASVAQYVVEHASPAEHDAKEEAVAVIVQAFSNDFIFAWLHDSPGTPNFFALVLEAQVLSQVAPHEQCVSYVRSALAVRADAPRGIVASAFCVAYPRPAPPTPTPALDAQLASLVRPECARLMEAFDGHLNLAMKRFMARCPSFTHVKFLGTRDDWQGRGAGAVLLSELLRRADAHAQVVYLEAPSARHRDWYARFGFRQVSDFPVDGDRRFYCMARQPDTAP